MLTNFAGVGFYFSCSPFPQGTKTVQPSPFITIRMFQSKADYHYLECSMDSQFLSPARHVWREGKGRGLPTSLWGKCGMGRGWHPSTEAGACPLERKPSPSAIYTCSWSDASKKANPKSIPFSIQQPKTALHKGFRREGFHPLKDIFGWTDFVQDVRKPLMLLLLWEDTSLHHLAVQSYQLMSHSSSHGYDVAHN